MNLIHEIFGASLSTGLLIILNLILIEGLLSIDNAAVLATMVGKLKGEERNRALYYGIWGALIMRGVCMAFASWLTGMWVLKIAGAAYLLWLTIKHFFLEDGGDEEVDPDSNSVFKLAHRYIGVFWSTVVLVELMDMAFSVDNIFAAVSFTHYIGLICTGVFIGIFCMRYIAMKFVALMEKFTFLANVAYVVIGLLGVKLMLTLPQHIWPKSFISDLISNEHFDMFFSLFTLVVFTTPIIWALITKKEQGVVTQIELEPVMDNIPIVTEKP
jgi:YkoY family integral membrane protein